MKQHFYNMVKSQLEAYEGNDCLAKIFTDIDSKKEFENKDATELYSAYLLFISEKKFNNFNREDLLYHLNGNMSKLLKNNYYDIEFINNDKKEFIKYLKENYLQEIPLNKTEQVDDVKALNKIIELGAKGALKELNVITQELSKDIAEDKKISLLTKQNEYLQALQIYFDKK